MHKLEGSDRKNEILQLLATHFCNKFQGLQPCFYAFLSQNNYFGNEKQKYVEKRPIFALFAGKPILRTRNWNNKQHRLPL